MNINCRYQKKENPECSCPCHCHYHYHFYCNSINPDNLNKSQIISEMNYPNTNFEFNTSSLHNSGDKFNYSYCPNINDKSFNKNKLLRERAKSVNDKINSMDFSKSVNDKNNPMDFHKNINNSKKSLNRQFDNDLRNIGSFQMSERPFNLSMADLKQKINKLNDENRYLTQLLAKVPRHDKSYINKLKLSFTNSDSRKKPNDIQPLLNIKKSSPTSIIMPPNDLNNVIMKSIEEI